MMYSVPVLHGRLPPEYIANWILLIRAYDLCLKWEISYNDLASIRALILEFVQGF
jgi:hypothetical protein